MKTAVTVLLVVLVGVVTAEITQEFVDKINSIPGITWRASMDSPTAKMDHDRVKHLLGTAINHEEYEPTEEDNADIPESFDSRTNWPNCPTMYDIRDQADCGSCWAFGAVESMSDRECITNELVVRLSAEDMNSCNPSCGNCNGGDPSCAWKTFKKNGIVTEDCLPYSLPSCDHHIANSTNPCESKVYYPTPACQTTCSNTTQKYQKYYGDTVYTVHLETAIQKEIMANGPCETTFTVFDDFLTYTGGIYQHVSGEEDGGHAVKFLGWGVENGVKYWLVANSWNEHWGEQGYFRILRGTNECGIETTCYAGIPASL